MEENINTNEKLDLTNSNTIEEKNENNENLNSDGEMINQENNENDTTFEVKSLKQGGILPKNENSFSNKKFDLVFKIMDIASFIFLIFATILAFMSAFSNNAIYFFVSIILCVMSSFLIGILLAFQLFEIFRKDSNIKNVTKSEKTNVIIKFVLILLILCFMAFMLVYITKLNSK